MTKNRGFQNPKEQTGLNRERVTGVIESGGMECSEDWVKLAITVEVIADDEAEPKMYVSL